MKNIKASILRILVNFFISRKTTYLIGMFFVRLSRRVRKSYHSSNNSTEKYVVDNCMGNIKMEVDINSYMGGSFYWSGFHHVNEILFLKYFLTPEMTMLDIGANQGEFTLYGAQLLKNGQVISFEPVNNNYNKCSKNIELNNFKNIELNRYGLSNKQDSLPIYTSIETELHSGIHEGLSTLFKTNVRNELEEIIDIKVFDQEYKNKLNRLDFVKIDIEGAELFALQGMEQTLHKFKPVLLMELNNDTFKTAGYSNNDVLKFLEPFGYKAYKLFRGKIKPAETFSEWGNYIFKVN